MNKRVLSLVLALMMVFAIPAFATGIEQPGTAPEDFLVWKVQNQYGILIENVEFNIYEKLPGQAEVKLDPVVSSKEYLAEDNDGQFPINEFGNEDVAYGYFPFYVANEQGEMVLNYELKPNAEYFVRANFPIFDEDGNVTNTPLNTDLQTYGYVDPTKEIKFTTDANAQVIEEEQTYVLNVPNCVFSAKVVGNNFLGQANTTVELVTLQMENGKYVLVNGSPVKDQPLDTQKSDGNGYVNFDIQKTVNADGKNVVTVGAFEVPAGQMLGLAINNKVVHFFNVYQVGTITIDDRYQYAPENIEKIVIDPTRDDFVPIEGCFLDGVNIFNITSAKNTATIRVWAMTDMSSLDDLKNDKLTKVPAVGAKVALYNNGTEGMFQEITKGTLREEGVIDANGYYDFKDVPADRVIRYLSASGAREVSLPYMVEATSMPANFYNHSGLVEVSVDQDAIDSKGVINVFLKVATDANSFGRIAGEDRYETALEVAKATFPNGIEAVRGQRTVILANGFSFPDALAGGVLTEAYNAPMLLTRANEIPADVMKYIEDEGVSRIVLLGGDNSISYDLQAKLDATKKYSIVRLEGDTRYDTAVAIGDHLNKMINDGSHSKFILGTPDFNDGIVFLANGVNFADALTASVPAAMHGAPLLLTNGTGLTAETIDALERWNPQRVVIVGGPSTVSVDIANQVARITGADVDRFYGEDRQITSMVTAKEFFVNSSKAYIANGYTPDALVSTLLAAKNNAPILLVKQNEVPEDVAEYIENSTINHFTIVGGPNSVSEAVRAELAQIMQR